MNTLLNNIGSEQAWDVARQRLEDYLWALRLPDFPPQEQEKMVSHLMERAAAAAAKTPCAEPTQLLRQQFQAAVELRFRLLAYPVRPVPDLNLSHMLPLPLANPLQAIADIPDRLNKLPGEWGRKLSPVLASVLAAIPVWLGFRLR